MTQVEFAHKNIVTDLMRNIAKIERLPTKMICKRIREGKIVILNNNQHIVKKPCAVGLGLRTKVNANIGSSSDCIRITDELKKLEIAIKYGADTVMDLSIGGDLKKIRRQIIKHSSIPV
ncbi:MAG: phosphomethylpyrimidine synthase ThiC, partial [Candidatus Omnitrophica bacterium]|nr:phosphomethylpyrimidine synthase ThiC [Candidatus Omnitrophota bacterium]